MKEKRMWNTAGFRSGCRLEYRTWALKFANESHLVYFVYQKHSCSLHEFYFNYTSRSIFYQQMGCSACGLLLLFA